MRARAPDEPVSCGYLELAEPSFEAAVSAALAAGAGELRIVPLFLGLGRHAREDIPRRVAALQAAHPGVRFELRPAIGEAPELIELMARIALR
jgi:sirohydrochlorin cobaltochelatase